MERSLHEIGCQSGRAGTHQSSELLWVSHNGIQHAQCLQPILKPNKTVPTLHYAKLQQQYSPILFTLYKNSKVYRL